MVVYWTKVHVEDIRFFNLPKKNRTTWNNGTFFWVINNSVFTPASITAVTCNDVWELKCFWGLLCPQLSAELLRPLSQHKPGPSETRSSPTETGPWRWCEYVHTSLMVPLRHHTDTSSHWDHPIFSHVFTCTLLTNIAVYLYLWQQFMWRLKSEILPQ